MLEAVSLGAEITTALTLFILVGLSIWAGLKMPSIIDDMDKIHTSHQSEAVEMRNALIDIADLLEESIDTQPTSRAPAAQNMPISAQVMNLVLERIMGNVLHGQPAEIQVGPEEGTIYAEENDTQNDQQQPETPQ